MVTVRDATDDDRIAVSDLHVDSVQELGSEAYDENVVRAWIGDDRDSDGYPIGDADVEFIVAERDGEVAGFGEVGNVDPADYPALVDGSDDALAATGEIRAVYVHPDHARSGVGTALLAELERRAHRYGFDSLVLTASLNAVPFYEHHGYEAVAELVHEFGGEVEGGAVVMRTSLG